MKTLILNGSPRKNGDCVTLIREIQNHLNGEVCIISSYYDGISPCIDCRYCKTHSGCSINDKMQEIYKHIEEYDNVILASPIYFSELSGSLLGLASRLQTYFCQRHFRGKPIDIKRKHGILVLAGAEKGTEKRAESTAKILFKLMNTDCISLVLTADTDNIPASKDKNALLQAKEAAYQLNALYEQRIE